MATVPAVPADLVQPLDALKSDLSSIFGQRLRSLVAYGSRLFPGSLGRSRQGGIALNTLALLDSLSFDDLQVCAPRANGWRRAGLAMPLLLGQDDFVRSLDVFPFEYGDIIARHVVVAGTDPFAGITVGAEDLRRACEAQAKSQLIHLREGFLEAQGRPDRVADLVLASAAPFAVLVGHVARLRGHDDSTPESLARAVEDFEGVSSAVVREVLSLVQAPVLANEDAKRLFPAYVDCVGWLVRHLDSWKQAGTR